MKKILLPTDFSDNAWNAISYAQHLFKNQDCKFYLLHAYTPVIYQIEYVLVSPAQFGLGDAIRETALAKMQASTERINHTFSNPRHTFETSCVFNTLLSEVKDTVAKKDIDLVVMGTKGATGAKEVLFGSNTVHVFKNVKCPVMAIPAHFKFESPHEILLPSDYEVSFENHHIQPLLDILKGYIARIHILHVYDEGRLTPAQENNKQALEHYFKHIAHLFHKVKHKNITDAINEFQVRQKINLLVMLNNKHSLFENIFFKPTVNQIGFHLNIPFLVIPISTKKQ